MTEQLAHTNCAGLKETLLPLITKTLGPEIVAISGSYLFNRIGLGLDDTMTESPIIHSDQAIATVTRWGHGDQNISLGSLYSCLVVQRGGIGQSINDGIGMNPPGTIGCNFLQGAGQGGFNIFNSVAGIYDFSNSTASWHRASIIENDGCDNLFRNTEALRNR